MKKPLNLTKIKLSSNKRYLSANGSSLLPLALRPRLFLLLGIVFTASIITNNTLFSNNTFAASITLTIPNEPISLSINPNKDGGYAKSDPQNIGVATEAFAGYTLTIAAKNADNGNNLVNGSNKLSSIASALTEEEYKGEGNINTWAFLPNKLDSSDNDKFQPGPTTSPITIDKTNVANPSPNSYALAIAAKVDKTLPSGEYSNTFVITAVANSVEYTINYNNLGPDSGVETPEQGTTTSGVVKLNGAAPTKYGHDFKGWCDQETSDDTCNGNVYQAGADYTITSPEDTTVNLWAMYVASDYGKTCQGTGIVLKDGKCWSKSDVATSVQWANASSYCSGVWHLPSQAEFSTLIRAYYPTASAYGTSYRYYFSGDASTFTNDWGATSGNWWSSTEYDSTNTYLLGLSSSFINSSLNIGKPYDFPVRCVSDDTSNPYTVNYNLNSGSGVTPSQTVNADGNNVKLDSTTPTRSGYNFLGWCDKETTSDTCSGTTYPAGANYPITNTEGSTITLWAMWKSAGPVNGDNCSRSGYSGAAKYYGGYCWMWSDYGFYTWANAKTACPSVWHLPSQSEFNSLLSAIGSGRQLYDAGWSGEYWSSTQKDSLYVYYLFVYSARANFYDTPNTPSYYGVRCVAQ